MSSHFLYKVAFLQRRQKAQEMYHYRTVPARQKEQIKTDDQVLLFSRHKLPPHLSELLDLAPLVSHRDDPSTQGLCRFDSCRYPAEWRKPVEGFQ
ncbi:hypothetical protein BaRGS_00028178 [Batillaria attramentaria]|uniref:Uncharacterized protein n=1 Tax=Batillaria attramentaria TaxID=370345 RepID=A0ABD0K166_9CAEN